MYRNFKEMRDNLSSVAPKTIVVAAAHDEKSLEAVYSAAEVLPMQYILVGNRARIMEISSKLGKMPAENTIVEGGDNTDCVRKAVSLVREGRGHVLMKGISETGALLKAVLDKEIGIRDATTMSHVAMLEVPAYHKLIAITDAAMLTYPTGEQKADIVRNAVAFCRRIGIDRPKVAALCAIESVSDRMPETFDAKALQDMCKRGELGECLLEGPISFDLAVSSESARVKGYVSSIAGDADILIVPNITVGNVLCKGLLYWGGAKMAGCVLGAKVPIAVVSRASSAQEKLLSILLCLKGGGADGFPYSGD